MREITLEELLEAGCHFGHQVTRSNPKARDFIFEARDNIHIIDLAKTKEGLDEAAVYVKNLSQKGGKMLVVACKKQAGPLALEEVKRAKEAGADGLYYITSKWIGGTLTNLSEVSKNFKKLKDITVRLQDENERAKYTKKEIGGWEKDKQKLLGLYGGIMELEAPPDALFVVDTHLEDLAVREAQKTNVITVGITDTNSDPTVIDYPIPANDDAAGSLKLIITHIIDAWIEGSKSKEAGVVSDVIATSNEERGKQSHEGIAASPASPDPRNDKGSKEEKPKAKRGRPKKSA